MQPKLNKFQHAKSRILAHVKSIEPTTLFAKINSLWNIHPSHAKRARYFKEAALKLEEKQANQAALKT